MFNSIKNWLEYLFNVEYVNLNTPQLEESINYKEYEEKVEENEDDYENEEEYVEENEVKEELNELYLINDNSVHGGYVAEVLAEVFPEYGISKIFEIVFEAHYTGKSLLIKGSVAELNVYVDILAKKGLPIRFNNHYRY